MPIIIMSAKDSDSDKAFGLGLGAFAIIAVLAVFLFAQCYLGIANDPETGVPDSAPGMDTMMVQVEMFTNLCFLVFTAVMMSVFVIAPAKNGIRNLMFGYPIRQKQIIISEMAAVWNFRNGGSLDILRCCTGNRKNSDLSSVISAVRKYGTEFPAWI